MSNFGSGSRSRLAKAEPFFFDSGLRCFAIECSRSALAELRFIYDGGFADEAAASSGTAWLANSVLRRSITRSDLARSLETLGGKIHGQVRADGSLISISDLPEHLPVWLQCLAQALQAPEIPTEELISIREDRLATISRECTEADNLALRLLPEKIYPAGHPYAQPFTGSGKTPADDVSIGYLARYLNDRMLTRRSALVVAGSASALSALSGARDCFAPNSRVAAEPELSSSPPLLSESATGGRNVALIDYPMEDLAALYFAVPTFPRNSRDADVLLVTEAVLSGMFTSRINLELRERRGWTYGMRSSLYDTRAQGLWIISCFVSADRALPAIEEIERQFRDLAGRLPCSPDELAGAIGYLLRRIPGIQERTAQIADTLAQALVCDLSPFYLDELEQRVIGITPDDITENCHQLLSERRSQWLVIGDAARLSAQFNA